MFATPDAGWRRSPALFVMLIVSVMAIGTMFVTNADALINYQCHTENLKCKSANGPEMYPAKEVGYIETYWNEGINNYGKGVCSKIWILRKGYWHEHTVCTETGETISHSYCPVEPWYTTGHGQVEVWYQKTTSYLFGREELYLHC